MCPLNKLLKLCCLSSAWQGYKKHDTVSVLNSDSGSSTTAKLVHPVASVQDCTVSLNLLPGFCVLKRFFSTKTPFFDLLSSSRNGNIGKGIGRSCKLWGNGWENINTCTMLSVSFTLVEERA